MNEITRTLRMTIVNYSVYDASDGEPHLVEKVKEEYAGTATKEKIKLALMAKHEDMLIVINEIKCVDRKYSISAEDFVAHATLVKETDAAVKDEAEQNQTQANGQTEATPLTETAIEAVHTSMTSYDNT